eukprot:scaffold26267_cov109-Isochrysis_galbana.AAC.2
MAAPPRRGALFRVRRTPPSPPLTGRESTVVAAGWAGVPATGPVCHPRTVALELGTCGWVGLRWRACSRIRSCKSRTEIIDECRDLILSSRGVSCSARASATPSLASPTRTLAVTSRPAWVREWG